MTAPNQAGVRTGIDRRSYNLSGDLQASTGSIGDALRNVPSVEVDPQGNVSLRGASNVTILVDGKPSGLFKGAGRASSIQQLPASQFERVEVMTNPSAAFDANASAGVINLISKKIPGQGLNGSLRASAGDGGVANGGGSISYNSRKLSLNADLNARRDVRTFTTTARREFLDPAAQRPYDSVSLLQGRTVSYLSNTHVGADYDVDSRTRISAEAHHLQIDFTSTTSDTFEVGAPLSDAKALSRRAGRAKYKVYDDEGSLELYRQFSGEDHDLTIDFDSEETINKNPRSYTYLSGAPAAGNFEYFGFEQHQAMRQLAAKYRRPLPGDAKLDVGLQAETNDYLYDNSGARGRDPAAATSDPSLTNRFRYGQAVSTIYATYERPFGKLTTLAGLRVESTRIETRQLTLGDVGHDDYVRAFPSLHLAYDLGDHSQIKGSYTQRIERPDPDDLDPFPDYAGVLSVTAGNSALKPAETRAVEAAYEYRNGQVYHLATAFFRDSKNTVTEVFEKLGGGAVLITKGNLGRQRNAGLELAAGGRLTRKLTYTLSATGYYSKIDISWLGPNTTRSTFAYSGKSNINWQITAKDLFQLNAQLNAKHLMPQGYRPAYGTINLGYQHKIDDRLAFVATVRDALNSTRIKDFVSQPDLIETIDRAYGARRFTVGMTYAFGSKPKRQSGFDYSGGPSL